jgi:hypothetical protein
VFERRLLSVALLVALAAVAATAGPTAATAQGHAPATTEGVGIDAATLDAETTDPVTVQRRVEAGERVEGGAAAATDAAAGTTPAATTDAVASTDAVATTDAVASTDAAAQIRVERRLARLPDRPGEIRTTLSVSVPDGVTELRLYLPRDVTAVTATDGFERGEEGRYDWTGADDPSLTLRVAVNRSASGSRIGDGSGYVFVDTGTWALVQVPSVGVGWSERVGTAASVVRETAIAGAGATSGEIAYLGAVDRYERAGADQSFTLAVPERASLGPDPATVLDSLVAGAERLRVGDRDESVFVVAAPQGTVEWGVRGLQTGPNDAWVGADEPVADPGNVWLHEYVHTRQDFETTDTGRWLGEASADYFAALLTLQQDRIDYPAFRDQLAIGAERPHDDAVLSDPSTWLGAGSNYRKGALVLGAIDRRLRLASDGERDLASVLAAMNRADEPLSTAAFTDLVAAGDDDLAGFVDRYATTEATPETWSAGEHAEAFGSVPAAIEPTALEASLTGPYRNRSVAVADGEPPRLAVRPAVGERLVLAVTLENAGGAVGDYDVGLSVDGTVVERRTGELAPGETTTLRFGVDVTDDARRLRVAGRDLVVDGVEPAEAAVTGLVVEPDAIDPGETTTVTATLAAPADRPAARTLTFRVGDSVVGERTVRLDAGERRAVSVTVEATAVGRFDVVVGTVERRLVVGDPTTTADEAVGGGSGAGSGPIPGPGAAVAALAVLATVAAGAARRRR